MKIAACWKAVALRPEVDPLTGEVGRPAGVGVSDADRSALEWALRLAEAWDGEAVVASAADAGADDILREALAAGVASARRVAIDAGRPSAEIAAALAAALSDIDIVVCGDGSIDRGTGSVPAYLAAELGAAQALGLVELSPLGPGRVEAERRLDGGRRERLGVTAPAVLSVEAGTARLRRASLPAVLAAASHPIERIAHAPKPAAPPTMLSHGPFRPRPRALAAPDAALNARERVLALTGALNPRTPPERLVLDPAAAADLILERLAAWGYHPLDP